MYVAHGGSNDAVLGVAIWGSPEEPKHSTLTLLRSGLWAGPVRLGIPAWRRRQALAPVLAALKPPGPCWYLNGIGVDPRRSAPVWVAATAIVHRLTVVTRNVSDFVQLGVELQNPFEGEVG